MRDDGEFLKDLRTEIQATQDRRFAYIRQKFVFVVGLFGVGSISILDTVDTLWVFYLVPFVAFAFDLYIYGEDFGVKRAGAFIRKPSTKCPQNEKEWEEYVNRHRDPMTKTAGAILSILVLLGSAIGLWVGGKESPLFWLWLVCSVAAIMGLRIYKSHLVSLEESLEE
jgi:hypothetical protein